MREKKSYPDVPDDEAITARTWQTIWPGRQESILIASGEGLAHRHALSISIQPVVAANFVVFVHRDRDWDKTLWCKVHNKGSKELHIDVSLFETETGND